MVAQCTSPQSSVAMDMKVRSPTGQVRTDGLQLRVVVDGHRQVRLDGADVQAGAEADHEEQRHQLADLPRCGAPVDGAQRAAPMEVEQPASRICRSSGVEECAVSLNITAQSVNSIAAGWQRAGVRRDWLLLLR